MDAFLKALELAHPEFYAQAEIGTLYIRDLKTWLIDSRLKLHVSDRWHDLSGNYYIECFGHGNTVYSLWIDPTPKLLAYLSDIGLVHRKQSRFVLGLIGSYGTATKSVTVMDTGVLVPQQYTKTDKLSLFSVGNKGISQNRMPTATKLGSLALQLRMTCAEAEVQNFPVENSNGAYLLRPLQSPASSALDLIMRDVHGTKTKAH